MNIELSDSAVALLRELLESQIHDLPHEIHHTDAREYKEQLKAKLALAQQLLGQLTGGAGSLPHGR